MKFESYADRGVESAVELVNRLSPGWARGRSWELPQEPAARRELAQEIEAKITGGSVTLRGQAGEELIRLAADLRSVFELMAQGRQDRAAALVNSLLTRYQAAPQLARHDGETWHLHFHSQDKEAGRAVARGAMCVIALAVVIGSPGGARLGICSSPHCDLAFIDTSKNGSRRFCSSTCLSRTKVAAFRARRADLEVPRTASGPAAIAAELPAVATLARLRRRTRLRAE
ncbi:MAG TPA: CGNR zinc finger domain-containing protein [Candidatus Dormibacteraeota bacterium]|nr:CGNR zinc finger domain-containing protein [Candidatus Dormibacteraeota bacterium]